TAATTRQRPPRVRRVEPIRGIETPPFRDCFPGHPRTRTPGAATSATPGALHWHGESPMVDPRPYRWSLCPPLRAVQRRGTNGGRRSRRVTPPTTRRGSRGEDFMATIRLGDEAPNFTAETTEGTIDFHQWKGD